MTSQPRTLPPYALTPYQVRTMFLQDVADNLVEAQVARKDSEEMSTQTHEQRMSEIEEQIENGGAAYWRRQAREAEKMASDQLQLIAGLKNRIAHLEALLNREKAGKLEDGR